MIPNPPYNIYEITVIGDVPKEMLETFPGLEPEPREGGTVLRVAVPSRAALQSMLVVIDLFELNLVGVRRLTPRPDAPSEG